MIKLFGLTQVLEETDTVGITEQNYMNLSGNSEKFRENLKKAESLSRTHPHEVIRLLEDLVQGAEETPDLQVKAAFFYNLGTACFMVADTIRSLRYLPRAYRCYEKLKDWDMIHHVASLIGVTSMNQGNLSAAMEIFSREYAIAMEKGIPVGCFKVNFQISQCFNQGRQYVRAKEFQDRAYQLLQQYPEIRKQTETIPMMYSDMIIMDVRLGRFQEADELEGELKRDIQMYTRFHHGPYEKVPLLYLHWREGRPSIHEEVLSAVESCLKIKGNVGENISIFMDLMNILSEMGEYEELRNFLEYLENYLSGTQYYRFLLNVSRAWQCYYRHYGMTGKLVSEMDRFWEFYDRSEEFSGRFVQAYMDMQDMLSMKQEENRKLQIKANTDALTGLANRRAFQCRFVEFMGKAAEEGLYFAVDMLDIDRFKQVNDSLGHSSGDAVLQMVGRILQKVSEENVFAARFGGDEFVVIFLGLEEKQVLEIAVEIRRMVQNMCENTLYQGVTVSQGIFLSVPEASGKQPGFLRKADDALYNAKISRTGQICVNDGTDLRIVRAQENRIDTEQIERKMSENNCSEQLEDPDSCPIE